MSKSLWGYYDGEPFMENPHLVVLNPRNKKGKKSMAKRSSKAHMAYVRSFRKGGSKRKYRRNAIPIAGVLANAPKRRKKAAPKRRKKLHYAGRIAKNKYRYIQNPRRRRHAYRSNPISVMGFQLPPLKMVAYGAAGFMGTPMVEHFVNQYLPASITSSPLGRYGVKIGCVILLTFAAKKVLGPEPAKVIGVGGGTYVLVSALNEFVVPKVTGVGSYNRSTPLGSYNVRSMGLGSYGTSLARLGAGTSQSRTGGGTAVVPMRLQRFAGR